MREHPTSSDRFIEHGPGEPCPVLALAHETFGDEGFHILLNHTCFPFSDEEAMKQLRSILAVYYMGGWPLLGEFWAAQNDEMERAMRESVERENG